MGGSRHRNPRRHHPLQALHCPRQTWLLGKQDRSSPHRTLQGDRQVWLRLGETHPRSTWNCIVSAPVPKKLLQMAGIDDCYTSARGSTGTLGNFAKATYAAVAATYAYLTPDLWKETIFQKSPYQEFTEYLSKNHRPVGVQRQEVKQY